MHALALLTDSSSFTVVDDVFATVVSRAEPEDPWLLVRSSRGTEQTQFDPDEYEEY
jgi:hypothetical protein